MTWKPTPPPAAIELNYEQYSGRACCWCGTRLWRGAVSAGIARGSIGAHVLDIEVYACSPRCPERPRRKTPGPGLR